VFFLEKMGISYDPGTAMILAVMELPAIVAAVCMASKEKESAKVPLYRALFHPSIALILAGMAISAILKGLGLSVIWDTLLQIAFKPMLVVFLFLLGVSTAQQGQGLKVITKKLVLFAFTAPFIGAVLGGFLSAIFSLDVGSSLLITLLCASASYIAVPAAMRLLFPSAKENVYLPLSLAVAFPFNVVIGVPLYYALLSKLL
jgi:hypothetical protein